MSLSFFGILLSPTALILEASFVFFSGPIRPLSNGMRVSESHPRKTPAFWSKLRSWTPDPKKMWKDTKSNKKVMLEMDKNFMNNLSFSLIFFVGFWMSLEEFFVCGLVAKVLQTGTTSGHFCSYITPKLESWKLVFRLDETLLFRILRSWVGTSWATFSNIFSGMDFGSWFYYSFEKLGVQQELQRLFFCDYFEIIFYVDFWWILGGTPNPTSGKGWGWFGRFWGT